MTRGEIWWAEFGILLGSEPGFRRPVLIIQDDAFNRSKINTIIVVPLTTNLALEEAPGNVYLSKEESKLSKDSVIVVSQVSAIDRQRLQEQTVKVQRKIMDEVEEGLKLVLGLK
ncbi:MAG: mRNA interferase MazF2 [Spirochaetae bacterium HGW-Spirochaetae-9]|nr:MAG: mRNA interferase MazF2 [Spirochaetae bacterium HGW-Spirochaetae-9]